MAVQAFGIAAARYGIELESLDAFLLNGDLLDLDREEVLLERSRAFDAYCAGEERQAIFMLKLLDVVREAAQRHTHVSEANSQRHEKVLENLRKATAATTKYSTADQARWRAIACSELAGHSKRRTAELIAAREGLAPSAAHTIRRCL